MTAAIIAGVLAQYSIWATQCALNPRYATSDYCLNAYRNCCYRPPQPYVPPQPAPYIIIIPQR